MLLKSLCLQRKNRLKGVNEERSSPLFNALMQDMVIILTKLKDKSADAGEALMFPSELQSMDLVDSFF